MPVSLTNLRDRHATARKDLGEFGDLNIKFNIGKLTPGFFQEASVRNDKSYLARTVADLVAEWDLTDSDGNVLPITEESCASLDFAILNLIMDLMKEASDPLVQKRKP